MNPTNPKPLDNKEKNSMEEALNNQKRACENAILDLMRSGKDHFYVRGVLESLILKIEQRLELNKEPSNDQ